MSTIKNKSVLLLIAALFIVSSSLVFAQHPEGDGKGKAPGHGEKFSGHGPMIPDLTDAQKEQMQNLHMELLRAMKPLQNEIGEKEARLHTLQSADKVNMSEINKVIEDIGQLRTKIMKLNVAHHQEIRSLLTEEQRVFFDAHHPPHGGHGEHHGQPDRGPR
ncbi:Spy/CpxP family protein refolding chaperone [candidate division WOR-3 bacterium]|nr:Spy/CpxP family protein refolding chaperone [candidate division WOR-3 bacterium]